MVATSLPATPAQATHSPLRDSHGRVIHDLRVSITDRCNYKCVYCRTGEEGAQYPELRIDEYLRLIGIFVGLGITKVRLTGGEPLLRRGVVELVRELAKLRTLNGEPLDLALTTNGHLLESLAAPLKAAGLNRVTVSMDAVDAGTFERITRVDGSFPTVLASIRAARAAGLTPVKINCVLLRGFNDDQIEGFARFAREENVVVRFIEFMPLEEGRLWTPEIVVHAQGDCGAHRPGAAAGGASRARGQRNRAALHICRRRGRDRHHCAGEPGFLRSLQPGAAHLRRKDSHLPVFAGGTRSLWADARRGERRRTARLHRAYRARERSAASHRRTGIPEAVAVDGAYRRLRVCVATTETNRIPVLDKSAHRLRGRTGVTE